jgi:hypothetical protein
MIFSLHGPVATVKTVKQTAKAIFVNDINLLGLHGADVSGRP